MKAYITDEGDPSVGIFPQTYELDIPLDYDADADDRKWFRKQLSMLYGEYAEGRLMVDFEDEIQQPDPVIQIVLNIESEQEYFGYVYDVTEFERGWGQRPDGHLIFKNESDAKDFKNAIYASRTSVVPECYDDYSNGRYIKITKEMNQELLTATEGRIWVKYLPK